MNTFALRLRPHQDLLEELVRFCDARKLQAGFVMTCVGSLERAALRLADQPGTTVWERKFEIVALTGTFSPDGAHLHLALADGSAATIGGHVMRGNLIYTTAEIVLGELTDVRFARAVDPETGYDELVVNPLPAPK